LSNRTYTILTALVGALLIAVMFASYRLHRLALTPASLALLAMTAGFPLTVFLSLSFPVIFQTLKPIETGARAANRRVARDDNRGLDNRRVAIVSALLLAASYLWMAGCLFLSSVWLRHHFGVLFLPWTVLFLLGGLGLIRSSKWVQTHGALIAICGLPVIAVSGALLDYCIHHVIWKVSFECVPVCLLLSGLFLLCVPAGLNYLRTHGFLE
jgi:hypothetical protein